MSIYVMAFIGTAPVGSLVAGTLAGAIGVQRTLFLGGLCCLASAAVFALRLPAFRELVRPLYVRIGVLPDEACLER